MIASLEMPAALNPHTYARITTEIIPIHEVIEAVTKDYPDLQRQIEQLKDIEFGIRVTPAADIRTSIIAPMNRVYDEYKAKIRLLKQIDGVPLPQSRDTIFLSNTEALNNVVKVLDSEDGKYDYTEGEDANAWRDQAGKQTMLNIYRYYIYGYLLLYEVHRIFVRYGMYIQEHYAPTVKDVMSYTREHSINYANLQESMTEAEEGIETMKAEAAKLEEEIEQLTKQLEDAKETGKKKDKIKELKDLIDVVNGEIDDLNAELENLKNEKKKYDMSFIKIKNYVDNIKTLTVGNIQENKIKPMIKDIRIQHGGDELEEFINDSKKRIPEKVQENLLGPAEAFFNACAEEFNRQLFVYKTYVNRLKTYYANLLANIEKINDIVDKRNKKSEREQAKRKREADKNKIANELKTHQAESNDLDKQIRQLNEQHEIKKEEFEGLRKVKLEIESNLKAIRDMNDKFEKSIKDYEASLFNTQLPRVIEAAKAQVDLIGVDEETPARRGSPRSPPGSLRQKRTATGHVQERKDIIEENIRKQKEEVARPLSAKTGTINPLLDPNLDIRGPYSKLVTTNKKQRPWSANRFDSITSSEFKNQNKTPVVIPAKALADAQSRPGSAKAINAARPASSTEEKKEVLTTREDLKPRRG